MPPEEQRTVCVVTGSRADYGHLYWVLRRIQEASALTLQVAVTAAHLRPEFGLTVGEIEADGFPVDARVAMDLSDDSPVGIARAMGQGTAGFADALDELRPDLLVILGDRFEMLCVALAALPARIPIAHLHGGERSQGAMDESIRHALTKLSHLHFTAAEPYRQRVIRMGEDPARVFNVGAPGLEHLTALPSMSREAWQEESRIPLRERNLMLTYHPATLEEGDLSRQGLSNLLEALDAFPEVGVVMTGTNADTHGQGLARLLQEYALRWPGRASLIAHLGSRLYLNGLRLMDGVVGNSSSGIIEAPAVGIPTLNLGSRQEGRLRAASVVDCPGGSVAEIRSALARILDPAFRAALAGRVPPYGQGGASQRIVEVLATFPLAGLVKKPFHDG